MTKKRMKSWPYLLLVLSFGCYELPELEETNTSTDSNPASTDSNLPTDDTNEPDSDSSTVKVCSDQIFCYEGRPENSCVDDQKIRVYSRGTCNDHNECRHRYDDYICNGEGGCDQGICLDDPCQIPICINPPQPKCSDDGIGLEHWTGLYSCNQETGKCNYEMITSRCPGMRCVDNRCERDPCTGLQPYCHLQRPASYCDDDTLMSFEKSSACDEKGECIYKEPTQTSCEFGCFDGLCIEADTQER